MVEPPFTPEKIFEDGPPPSGRKLRAASALERIRQRGAVRVGYARDRLPYAFVNSAGHLVGFDVELAHVLARELGIGVEFVRIDFENLREHLTRGDCDLVSSVSVTTARARELDFSRTYLPHYKPPEGMTRENFFKGLCDEGFRQFAETATGITALPGAIEHSSIDVRGNDRATDARMYV